MALRGLVCPLVALAYASPALACDWWCAGDNDCTSPQCTDCTQCGGAAAVATALPPDHTWTTTTTSPKADLQSSWVEAKGARWPRAAAPIVTWLFFFMWLVAIVQGLKAGGIVKRGIVLRFIFMPHQPAEMEYYVLAIFHMALAEINMLIMSVEMVHIARHPSVVGAYWGAMILTACRDAGAVKEASMHILAPMWGKSADQRYRLSMQRGVIDAAVTLFARAGGWFGGMFDFHVILVLCMPIACQKMGPAMYFSAVIAILQHAMMHREWICWQTQLMRGYKPSKAKPPFWCWQTVVGLFGVAGALAWFTLASVGGANPTMAFIAWAYLGIKCVLMGCCSCKDNKDFWEDVQL